MSYPIDDFSLNSMSHDKIADSIYLQIKYALLCVRYIGKIRNNKKQDDLSSLVDSVFNDFDSILAPIQFKSEIIELLEIIKHYEPINILEIGSANGGTLYLFSRVASTKARLLGVDVPFGRYSFSYSIIKRIFFELVKLRPQILNFIERDSHDPYTAQKIESYILGKKFDFIFIDGDHSYEGVKKDFELYSPLVRDGGLICFHDIVHHPPGTVSHAAEVDIFWEEIKSKHDYLEIIESDSQVWGGIGVIRKGGIPSRSCKKISFGYGASFYDVDLEGFSQPEAEASFSWTDSDKAVIRTIIAVDAIDSGYILEFRAMPFIFSEPNYADVYVNGIKVKRWGFESQDKRRFRAFFRSSIIKADGVIEIELIFSQRFSPQDIGISTDTRKLGLAIFDLEIKTSGIQAMAHT